MCWLSQPQAGHHVETATEVRGAELLLEGPRSQLPAGSSFQEPIHQCRASELQPNIQPRLNGKMCLYLDFSKTHMQFTVFPAEITTSGGITHATFNPFHTNYDYTGRL